MSHEIAAAIDDVGSGMRRNPLRIQQTADRLQMNVDADDHSAVTLHRRRDRQRRNIERSGHIRPDGNRHTILDDGLVPGTLPRIERCVVDVPLADRSGPAVEKAKRRDDIRALSLRDRSDREGRAIWRCQRLTDILSGGVDDLQIGAIGIAGVNARRLGDVSQNLEKDVLFWLDILRRRGNELRQVDASATASVPP